MNKEINAINLRPVTMADAQILYKWRNDPQTRTVSHNQDEIDFDTHLKWLDKKLKGYPSKNLHC